ncbi:hypothetical protein HA402_001955 [Bradysia odoriphaga]|uniref:coiled-coil domain-containing protein 58 n=1 Tax=Bradysia coprophila TaxID=38358 RepID=UPI00187D8862|nr:coiled-coil domain-containing protein 58 [Bradysia coprophila]KAG4076668.1 hypothetical protein HA402_001955 [Bradysia odoriphaga]
MAIKYECGDFLQFQESLKKMRELDDKIIYALNTSIPTESFKGQISPSQTCERLYNQLQENYTNREKAITNCILVTADSVKGLKVKRDENRDDISATQAFKNEQRKLRMLQSELNVEDIIKQRTVKTFNERCRMFFTMGAL